MNLYFYEIGTLLNEKHPQYNEYKGVWNTDYSYYNENWGFKRTEDEAIDLVKKYARSSRNEYYGLVAKITGFDDDLTDKEINDLDVTEEDMVAEKVIYSIRKQEKDGSYREGFIEGDVKKKVEPKKPAPVFKKEEVKPKVVEEPPVFRVSFMCTTGEKMTPMVFDRLLEQSLESVRENIREMAPYDGVMKTEKLNNTNGLWISISEEEVQKRDYRNDEALNRKYWDSIDEKIYNLIKDLATCSATPIEQGKLEDVIWHMVSECRDMLIDSFELNLSGSYPVVSND